MHALNMSIKSYIALTFTSITVHSPSTMFVKRHLLVWSIHCVYCWNCNQVRKQLTPKNPGPWFNIKMSSYQYRKSHCGDKTVVRSSYLHNGISYTGKMTSLYWFGPLVPTTVLPNETLISYCLCSHGDPDSDSDSEFSVIWVTMTLMCSHHKGSH